MPEKYGIDDLIYLMQRLRDPEAGCPWDLKQNYRSIVPSTLEEAYEVADTIERGDYDELKSELGDLVFQVIFYSQLASEESRFDFSAVVHELVCKLISRHPHVFPDGSLGSKRSDELPAEAISGQWESLKQKERAAKGYQSVLDDVPDNLPALTRAQKLQKRAASIGFDWDNYDQVFDVIESEIAELRQALEGDDPHHVAEEMGDLLFSCVNLARKLRLDSEQTLREGSRKFDRRFRQVELIARESGQSMESMSLEQLEVWWQQAKAKTTKDSLS